MLNRLRTTLHNRYIKLRRRVLTWAVRHGLWTQKRTYSIYRVGTESEYEARTTHDRGDPNDGRTDSRRRGV